MKMMSWLIAWLVMFLLVYSMSRTRVGNVVIYYVAWLLLFLLIVTHASQLISSLTGGGF